MEQFSLDKWLQDKSRKVVTRTGEPVEIVLTDWGDPFPILGRIGNSGDPIIWLSDGRSDMDAKLHDNDLFFADEEEELTEFENALLAAFYSVAGKAVTTIGPASFQEDVNEWSKALLDIARKELKNNDWRQSLRSYKNAYEQGKQEALKDAVETIIVDDWQYGKDSDRAVIPAIHQRIKGFNVGDKVKVIIKED